MNLAWVIVALLKKTMPVGVTVGVASAALVVLTLPLTAIANPTSVILQNKLLLAQRSGTCRRIIAETAIPFYSSFPREGARYTVLQPGEKVAISDEQSERGPNGRSYLYVAAPHNSTNPNRGYIPTQYQTRTGEFRGTLGSCEGRRARW